MEKFYYAPDTRHFTSVRLVDTLVFTVTKHRFLDIWLTTMSTVHATRSTHTLSTSCSIVCSQTCLSYLPIYKVKATVSILIVIIL